jgi:hypothetical protein
VRAACAPSARVGGVGGGQDLGAGPVEPSGVAVVDGLGGHHRDPGMAVLAVVPAEELLAERPGVLERAEPVGEARPVLQGLELALGIGLSLETCGREWGLVIPRSASSNATGLELIELPRSACTVS